MDTLEFFQRVLPDDGYYVLAIFKPTGKPIPRHRVLDSKAEAAALVARLDQQEYTIYHACASYAERKVWDEKKKKWRIRVADNAAFVRSQWLDIDVGKGKDYTSRKAAIVALKEVCTELNLPPPLIVSSGRGLHCYWTFTHDVPADIAVPQMEAFSAALKAHEFKHDTSRTCDIASVLRPVGSHHRKAEPVRVKMVMDAKPVDPDKFYEPVQKYLALPAAQAPVVSGAQADDWGAGTKDFPPSSAKLIAPKCRALFDVAKAKGDVAEPYWRAMIGLVKFTVEGERLIHRWSEGDPRYDAAETQEKIDNYDKPPTTCAQFDKVGADCSRCPFKGQITSPIHLGYDEDEAPPKKEISVELHESEEIHTLDHYAKIDDTDQLPFWPKGYSWDGEQLHKFVKDPDTKMGEWRPFSGTLYYPFLRYETEDRTRAMKVCALADPTKNRWRVFDIETTKVAEPQALAYALGAHEVLYMPASKALNRQFVQDVLYGLRDNGLETTTYNSFGWHGKGVVVGDQQITKKGALPVFLGTKIPEELHDGFGESGTATEWVKLVDEIYNRPGAEPFQFAICAGFAAPLVKLCQSDMWHGVPIGLTGGSGIGKSTTAKVACSMFGDPRKFTVQANDEGTTLKALIQRIATMRNLPLVMDEITGRETNELQALLFALSNGKPKLRLRPDGQEINAGQSWDTIAFITGNLSITRLLASSEALKTDATQVRCFEIALDDDYAEKVFSDINAKDLIEHQLLGRQFGVVGREYLSMLVKHHEKITNMLQRERSKFAAKTQEESRERFYYDLIATVMVAAHLASKMGMVHFDLKRLRKWALQHVRTMRVSRKESTDTPEDYLQSFLSHIHQHTVITRYFRDGRQKIEGERVVEPLREPLARNAVDDGIFMFTLKSFQDWCVPRKIDPSWLLTQLEKSGHVTGPPTRQRICKGTKISGTQARCVSLNYDEIDGTLLQLPEGISVVSNEEADNA